MRTFRSLATDEEYARTQADFVALIDAAATRSEEQLLGVRGNSQWVARVRYLEPHDIWFANHQLHNRNWNGFGVGSPFGSQAVPPSIQINLGLAPRGPSLAGCFMVDDRGDRWVGHNGRLGGGKDGVTIAAFLAFYPHSEAVRIDRKDRDLIVLGRIEGPDPLLAAVAAITKAAKAFRDQLGAPPPYDDPDDE
jgi:hypothetical protein